MKKVNHLNSSARHFIFISRTDTTNSGANFSEIFCSMFFAKFIQEAVIRKDNMSSFADSNHFMWGSAQSAADSERVNFFKKDHRIKYDSVCDQADLSRMKDTTGNEVKDGLFSIHD